MGKSGIGTASEGVIPSLIVLDIVIINSIINAPIKIPATKVVVFFFLIKSSVDNSLKFSFAIFIFFDCDCTFMLAANGKGLWSGGAFETLLTERQPI